MAKPKKPAGNAGKGRVKGSKNKRTAAKEMEEMELRSLIRRDLEPMLQAQIANAKGIKFLMVRERKGGKFKRVVETMAKTAKDGTLGQDEEIIEVWEKDPSVHAWDSLLNRAYGKPKESVDINLHFGDKVMANLMEGRKRVAEARKAKSGDGSRKH